VDSELKNLLEKTLSVAEENNKLLHKVRGVQKRQALWTAFKLLVIVGLTLGSFYYLEPYVNKMMDTFNQLSGMQKSLDSGSFKDMFNKF
jgi:hypothetical protein